MKDYKYRADYPLNKDEVDFSLGFTVATIVIITLLKLAGILSH